MTFFRQAALLLPSAFLLGVLLFLVTHGRDDPAFGVYPFFEEWGSGFLASNASGRFLQQSLLFFGPFYVLSLLFILCLALAETALFGPARKESRSDYSRAFAAVFALLYLLTAGAMVFVGERLGTRYAPGALIAPLLVALVPFLAAIVAFIPAAVLALPVAAIRKAHPA